MPVEMEYAAGCLDPASLVRFYQEELSQIAHELIQVLGWNGCCERWGKLLAADPYYSPNLSRTFPGYRVDASSRREGVFACVS